MKFIKVRLIVLCLSAVLVVVGLSATGIRAQVTVTRFAIIGDYGSAGQPELDVANLVKSWNPDFIITTGDNNYSDGAAATIDQNIGQYYHDFIGSYTGSYGAGAVTNKFFPSLGNHDWVTAGAVPYLNYFTLSGNERYYDFVRGSVHLFAIDSDPNEPDGISSTSVQATWLQNALAASTSPWKIVYFHHPPYSSATHGSTLALRWPFQTWGASAVVAGHEHAYERFVINSFPYIVNGLGGNPNRYTFGTPLAGSVVRYNADWGAQLVEATDNWVTFKFITRTGVVIDTYSLGLIPTNTPRTPVTPVPRSTLATPPPIKALTFTPPLASTQTLTPTYTLTPIVLLRIRPTGFPSRYIRPLP
jgi:tartrate-resistant acid phosphatase type 5